MKKIKQAISLLFASGVLLSNICPAALQAQLRVEAKAETAVYNEKTMEEMGILQWICPDIVQVSASSELEAEGREANYRAKNLLSPNLKKVWIEGEEGYGEGSVSLSYTFVKEGNEEGSFKGEFICFNGYMYNETVWNEHSRVRSMRVYLNEAHLADLYLEDLPVLQTFRLPFSCAPGDVLRFELNEYYAGSAYQDVALSFLLPVCTF